MIKEISGKMNDFMSAEKEIELRSPQVQARDESLLVSFLCTGILLSIVLAVALAIVFARRIANRLNVIDENTFQAGQRLGTQRTA